MWMWAAMVGFGTVFASLYSGHLMWSGLVLGPLLTLGVTFVLPRLTTIHPLPRKRE